MTSSMPFTIPRRYARASARAVTLAGLLAVAACGHATLADGELAIVGARLVSLTGEEPTGPVTIVVRADTIVTIEATPNSTYAPAPNVVEANGRYLLPGLIDPHVHVRRSEELALFLGAGVTTVRNMNGAFGTPLAWRDSLERGELVGPRLVTASPTLFDGLPDYAYHVEGPDTARAMVRRFRAQGYDLVKVYQLVAPTVRALTEEAARLGMPVAGHIPLPADELEATLSLGMVSLEHLDEFVGPGFGGHSDYARIPEVARKLAAAEVTVGTVLSQWLGVNRALDDPSWLLNDSLVATATRYWGPDGREQLETMAESMSSRTEESRAHDRSDFDFLFALLRGLVDAGVNVVASTDAHQPLAPAGEGLWNELELLVEAGLTPRQALRAATVNPARLLGAEHRAGRVAVGAHADLLLLDRDPSEDISAVRRPWGLVARGTWFDAPALGRMRGGGG